MWMPEGGIERWPAIRLSPATARKFEEKLPIIIIFPIFPEKWLKKIMLRGEEAKQRRQQKTRVILSWTVLVISQYHRSDQIEIHPQWIFRVDRCERDNSSVPVCYYSNPIKSWSYYPHFTVPWYRVIKFQIDCVSCLSMLQIVLGSEVNTLLGSDSEDFHKFISLPSTLK